MAGEAQKPTIGQMVHYQAFGTPGGEHKSEPRAAVVTGVHPDSVSLCVLSPSGMFFNPFVPYSSEPKPGHWNWPPRA